jgi:hypothetical protein
MLAGENIGKESAAASTSLLSNSETSTTSRALLVGSDPFAGSRCASACAGLKPQRYPTASRLERRSRALCPYRPRVRPADLQYVELSQVSARSVPLGCSLETIISRVAIRSGSTRSASRRAPTKLRSFSRSAISFATQRSSLSRHQPVKRGLPAGAAVLAFCTLTRRSRQPWGRTAVSRSTPSMLKPWSSSKGENSPATPRSGRPVELSPRCCRRPGGCPPRSTSSPQRGAATRRGCPRWPGSRP